nr:uncharacterized protein LOC129447542 [Misgurnus anguillicaudatus]
MSESSQLCSTTSISFDYSDTSTFRVYSHSTSTSTPSTAFTKSTVFYTCYSMSKSSQLCTTTSISFDYSDTSTFSVWSNCTPTPTSAFTKSTVFYTRYSMSKSSQLCTPTSISASTFECDHIKSLAFCPRSADDAITLNEEVLMELVQQKWFGEDRKQKCTESQRTAGIMGVPLSVEVTFAGPSSKKFISVYEPKTSYYSHLGRVIVVYDSKKITWSCPCNKTKQSCVHKSIAKWHLFQTHKSLFRKVRTTEWTDPPQSSQFQMEDLHEEQYPPNEAGIKKMVLYLLKEKSLPADLPKELISGTKPKCEFPRSLIPEETFCSQCMGNQMLSDPKLITSRARILTFTGLVEGISTYYKVCNKCKMMYRYQEFTDGIHNFNDHLLILLHLCLIPRNTIQVCYPL